MPLNDSFSSLCVWHECAGCVSPVSAGDAVAARQWAAGAVGVDATMARLRLHAAEAGLEPNAARADDQNLADSISAGIASGLLKVCGAARSVKLLGFVASLAPAPAPAAPAPARQRSAAAPPPAFEVGFAAGLDVAAMVAVLKQAAQDGTPFCEECAKAGAEAAA